MFFCKSDSGKGNSQRNIGFAHFGGNIGTHNDKILLPPQLLLRWVMYKKESVELFAYPNRGSDKTLAQISKSPHLAVYIGMIYSYTNEECLSCLLSC